MFVQTKLKLNCDTLFHFSQVELRFSTVQDENVRLIHSLMAHQRCGAVKEAAELQQALHRNLVYLATIADRTTAHANAPTPTPGQPGVTGVSTAQTGTPGQSTQPHFAPPGNVVAPQSISGPPMNPNAPLDRNPSMGMPPTHPGPPTTVPMEHVTNPSAPVASAPSGLMSVSQPSGPIHTPVYPANQMPQTANGHEIPPQDVSGRSGRCL
ncbi:unnamed protein product [Echinostoma caproni]|uniref:SSXT domain-containing protein n=1 Tax=Echinostoma caproni TaxID=27848 RepID=A0A183AY29_9TREM|nr:unnamed protein product [Echinostoma caproni]